MAEILAPCGSPETLRAALRAGCSAVYLGGESFSARQNAVNFSDDEIEQAVFECHKRGVKLYRTINTALFDDQLEDCIRAVEHSAKVGVDGLITQDLALIEIVKKCCPKLPIHASTQMTVHTADGMEMTKELGFARTVLSRELPIPIIKRLSAMGIETEVFVHGALCMSVSGQCYMSAVIGSRSANRGLCAQACRLPCSAVGRDKNRYDLSLKDLSCYDIIGQLVGAGVSSLKIEGRMKRPEYAAMAVDCCKKALNGEGYDKQTLAGVFSRSGFTDGYLTGRIGREMFGYRQKEDVEAAAKALPKIHEIYRSEEKRGTIDIEISVRRGEPVQIKACDSRGVCAHAEGEIPQTAQNKAVNAELVQKQLSKLGDTIYTLGKISSHIDEELFVSPSELNRLRREVCERLDSARVDFNTKRVEFKRCDILPCEDIGAAEKTSIRVCTARTEQLSGIDPEAVEWCAVPLHMFEKAARIFPAEKLAVQMPRFTFDEDEQNARLEKAAGAGAIRILAANIAHIKAARRFGLDVHTDFGLNITNSVSLRVLKELGVRDAVVSFELKAAQIGRLKRSLPIGIFAYGRLPLMLTVNCPIMQAVGCKGCTHFVTDRTDRSFPVKCNKNNGYVEILNSEVLFLANRLDKFGGVDFFMLNFYDESADEAARIIAEYSQKIAPQKRSNTTAGLYFRGVL